MNVLPALIVLQEAASEASPFNMLVPMAAIFGIFYFLLIRPQQKKQKETESMLKGIEKGDQVVTAGGLHGKVTGVADDVITPEVANLKGVPLRVKQSRSRVDHVEKAKKGDAS